MIRDADKLAVMFSVATKVYMLVHKGLLNRDLEISEGYDLGAANAVLSQTCGTTYYSVRELSDDIEYLRIALKNV